MLQTISIYGASWRDFIFRGANRNSGVDTSCGGALEHKSHELLDLIFVRQTFAEVGRIQVADSRVKAAIKRTKCTDSRKAFYIAQNTLKISVALRAQN